MMPFYRHYLGRQTRRPLNCKVYGNRFTLHLRRREPLKRSGARIEAQIVRVLASLARIGQIYTAEGRTFSVRRAA